MTMDTISLIFFVCFTFYLTYAHIFTSTARLAEMFKSNAFIVKNLEQYILKEEDRLNTLKTLKEDILTLKGIDLGSPISLVEHPVGALRVVQTFHRLEREIENSNQWARDLNGALKQKGIDLPTVEDIEGTYNAILRIQRMYQLKAEDLMNGIVGTKQIANITATAAFEIGNCAENQEINKPLAIQWWEAAIQNDVSRRQLTTQSRRELLLKLTRRHMELGHTVKISVHLNQSKNIYETDVESKETERQTNNLENISADEDPSFLYNLDEVYSALCRADPSAIISNPLTSVCILMPQSVPYDVTKVEVMSIDPFVVVFHGVIFDSEASVFKDVACKKLKQARIHNSTHVSSTPETRAAQMSWIYDTAIVEKMAIRLQTITGLDARQPGPGGPSEPFHVVNYGIGGHYKPHWDYADKKQRILIDPTFPKNATDRLATFMFYLNDVEEGGATVFPYIGLRIPPTKGSAVFWFNLHRSGHVDARTLHAGCPVLLGQKWIATKWILENGQEFRHGCGLYVNDLHYRFGNRQN